MKINNKVMANRATMLHQYAPFVLMVYNTCMSEIVAWPWKHLPMQILISMCKQINTNIYMFIFTLLTCIFIL